MLTVQEMPTHDHKAEANSANATTPIPTGNVLAAANNVYRSPTNLTALRTGTIANAGNNELHENMQPFLTIKYLIALAGVFPSRN